MLGLPVVKLPGWIQTTVANGSGIRSENTQADNKIREVLTKPVPRKRECYGSESQQKGSSMAIL